MLTYLPYGLKNGVITHVSKVDSGLKCECFCPSCNSPLIARKGKIKSHHFAHYDSENCSGGLETAIHLAAKEIIEKHKKIKIPALCVYDQDYTHDTVILSSSKWIEFDRVLLEKSQGDFRPDIIGEVGDTKLLIEVALTHFVDYEKKSRVERRGTSLIEIDLCELQDGFSEEELSEVVINSVKNKEWIYNAKLNKLWKKKLERLKAIKHEREQRLRAQEFEKQRLLDSENRNTKIAKRNGFEVIEFDSECANGDFFCPKKMYEQSKILKSNHVSILLKEGAKWNGRIYGHFPRRRWIYLDNKEVTIFENSLDYDHYDDAEIERKIYGQLLRLIRYSQISCDDCEKCEYHKGLIREDGAKIACGFRKWLWKKG